METHATLTSALTAANVSIRLTAALAIGADPDPGLVELVFERCAVEPDFYVRDMLTWALTRFPNDVTVPRLLAELGAGSSQARSQALHTLSKIKDARTWPAITRSLLRDPDDDVARSAWRAAVVLVPDDQRQELARELAAQLGGGHSLLCLLQRCPQDYLHHKRHRVAERVGAKGRRWTCRSPVEPLTDQPRGALLFPRPCRPPLVYPWPAPAWPRSSLCASA